MQLNNELYHTRQPMLKKFESSCIIAGSCVSPDPPNCEDKRESQGVGGMRLRVFATNRPTAGKARFLSGTEFQEALVLDSPLL